MGRRKRKIDKSGLLSDLTENDIHIVNKIIRPSELEAEYHENKYSILVDDIVNGVDSAIYDRTLREFGGFIKVHCTQDFDRDLVDRVLNHCGWKVINSKTIYEFNVWKLKRLEFPFDKKFKFYLAPL